MPARTTLATCASITIHESIFRPGQSRAGQHACRHAAVLASKGCQSALRSNKSTIACPFVSWSQGKHLETAAVQLHAAAQQVTGGIRA